MQAKLDALNHNQRAMYARALYKHIALKTETPAQRYALALMLKPEVQR